MTGTRRGSEQRTDSLKVFINYRRADTEGYAGRLYEALRRPIGAANLFMDVDSMRPGQNFVKALDDAVAACDVVLAMIGPAWLPASTADGKRRIDDPLDYVRLELGSALSRDKVVIPLLFSGAEMPSVSDLPEALRDLPTRNALVIRHDRFRGDVAELIKELRRLQRLKEERAAPIDAGEPAGLTREADELPPTPGATAGGAVAAQATPPDAGAPVPVPVPRPEVRSAPSRTGRRSAPLGIGLAAVALAALVAVLSQGAGRASPEASLSVGARGTGPSGEPGGAGPSASPRESAVGSASTGPLASPIPSGEGPAPDDARYLSPDGSLAAVVHLEPNGYFEIYVERADGSDARNVSNHPDADLFVTWRPDSGRLAFISQRDLNDEVYAVDPDGSDMARLTSTAEDEAWPAWSPDGSLILFTRTMLEPRQIDLWLMTPSGTEQRAVVTSPDDEGLPSWTPDGRIRFTRFTATGTQQFVVNADGSGLTPLP